MQLYVILVKWGVDNSWTVSRRFQEFDVLNTTLLKKIQHGLPFPAKTWFKSFEPDFVEQRRAELQLYLQGLANSRVGLNAIEFKNFLELSVNVPGIDEYLPSMRITLQDPKFGVNAHVYDHKRGLLLTCSTFPSHVLTCRHPRFSHSHPHPTLHV
jgi:hypothetical protein